MSDHLAPSILASWTRTLIDALKERGVEIEQVLASAGLSAEAFRDPNARLPIGAAVRLWRKAAQHAGEPAFGLRASKHVRQTTFHALGYAVLASSTLHEALDRVVRYSRVVSDVATLELQVEGDRARLLVMLRAGYDAGGEEAMDAILALMVRACRMLLGDRFPLHEVEMRRHQPADPTPYAKVFRCPVRFGSTLDALSFDAAILDTPLPAGNPELAHYSDAAVREYLARVSSGSVVDRVRSAIVERVGTATSSNDIARRIGMSQRSMQRALQASGTTYEGVLADVRKELACAYLRDPRYSVSEVAFLLGYENLGAFTRAFKRWNGLSPSEYAKRR